MLSKTVRTPFFKLTRRFKGLYGLVSENELTQAGFDSKSMEELLAALESYSRGTKASRLVRAVCEGLQPYYSEGQRSEVFFPRLRTPGGEGQPATFIFSGTATLSPEISRNPNVVLQSEQLEETYERLQIIVQRGDALSTSKTALAKSANMNAAVQWLSECLPGISQRHSKVLLVTYQSFSTVLWARLADYHDLLIPYVDGSGEQHSRLPYFGGLNGSNLYQEATCVIALGLNRFEPRDYISRAIALDFDGQNRKEFQRVADISLPDRLDRLPCVMDIQDITLARDLVQLLFRSGLRRHGEDTPIEMWLLQPPNGVLHYLERFFPRCNISEISDFSDTCKASAVIGKQRGGEPTSAAKLLRWLMEVWDGRSITPEGIRIQTGLTKEQFKEAKKNESVHQFFARNVDTFGSGRNTTYQINTRRSVS